MNPPLSSVRPGIGVDSGTPNMMAKNTSVTQIAGTASVTGKFPPVAANTRLPTSAPMIAPASRATTRRPAARRVVDAPLPLRRPRSKISATSSGSQTT